MIAHVVHARCLRCDRPTPTDAQRAQVAECDGMPCTCDLEHVCFGGCDPIDWQSRAGAAEAELCALQAERDGLLESLVDALDALDLCLPTTPCRTTVERVIAAARAAMVTK